MVYSKSVYTSANLTKLELALCIKEKLNELTIIEESFSEDPDQRDYLVSNERIENLNLFYFKGCKLLKNIDKITF